MPKVNKRARKASSDESSSDSGPEDVTIIFDRILDSQSMHQLFW